MSKLDHPCKDTCSGWQQGYERGEEAQRGEAERLKKSRHILRAALEKIAGRKRIYSSDKEELRARIQVAQEALSSAALSAREGEKMDNMTPPAPEKPAQDWPKKIAGFWDEDHIFRTQVVGNSELDLRLVWITIAEAEALISQARREGRAEAFEEAADAFRECGETAVELAFREKAKASQQSGEKE